MDFVRPAASALSSDSTGSFAGAFIVTGVVLLLGILCYTVVLGRMDRMAPPPVPA